ncbi:MAG: sulfite exporter TauE/SafE family protein [Gemmatimonadetes bacterium]|nr:sulfite exporter TauE/SafE family protein [Gemmatimonadota bacterium]
MALVGFGLAVVVGVVLGLLGGGGSIMTIPVLVYALGVPMKQAVPMSLIVVGVTSMVGAVSHHRRGNVRWEAALSFSPTAILGAFVGARLAHLASNRVQLVVFAFLMLAAAVSMFFGPGIWQNPVGPAKTQIRRPFPIIAALGLGVGMLTGLVGVGGGFLYVPALVLLGGLAMKDAVGTSLILIIASCLAGFISYLGTVRLDWSATGLFTVLAIVGVAIGSRLTSMVPQTALRRGFAVLLVFMGLLVLFKPR